MHQKLLEASARRSRLNAELDEYFGYPKHRKSSTTNSRHGTFSKTIIADDGQF
jgi:putative transposase